MESVEAPEDSESDPQGTRQCARNETASHVNEPTPMNWVQS